MHTIKRKHLDCILLSLVVESKKEGGAGYGTFDEIGLSMNTAITIFLKACAREKRIPFELTADPFYSSANQRYLEGIMRDVRSGKAHFAPHDLIEEA